MIQHICPNCETTLHSTDGLGGTPIQCWKCHTTVVVPPKSVKMQVAPEFLAQAATRAKEAPDGERPGIWQSFKALLRGRTKKTESAVPPG